MDEGSFNKKRSVLLIMLNYLKLWMRVAMKPYCTKCEKINGVLFLPKYHPVTISVLIE